MIGSPFNLLASRPPLPVVVSRRKKAVWGDPDGGGKCRAGLGAFASAGPLLLEAPEFWKDGDAPSLAEAASMAVYEELCVDPDTGEVDWYYRGDQKPSHWRRFSWMVEQYNVTFVCDRVLLCQNCAIETRDNQGAVEARIVFGETPRWHAPMMSGGVTGQEAAVRPWTGPAGDLEGWIGGRYADFAPLSKNPRPNLRPLQLAANSLFRNGPVPAAWHLPEGVPLARVIFKNSDAWKNSGVDSETWVETHAPDRILRWVEVEEDEETEEKRLWLENWHPAGDPLNPPGALLSEAIDGDGLLAAGCAFDLFALVETWGYRHRLNDPDLSVLADIQANGYANYNTQDANHWYTADPRIEDFFWKARLAARIVKPLPPKGGA